MRRLLPLPVLTTDLLTIYLNDHLAGSVSGLELARRATDGNRGTELGDFLDGLAGELDQDRRELERIMEALGVRRDGAKVAAAWLAEKAGRLKPNGQLVGHSPLSGVLELEGLQAGVQGKLSLWRTLLELARDDARLDEPSLTAVAGRAERQLKELRRRHAVAAREALASPQGR